MAMKAHAVFSNPAEMELSLSISMSIREWKLIQKALESTCCQAVELKDCIRVAVETAESRMELVPHRTY